ncbi:MAG: hypothetical protein JO091_03720 [Acidobacteriaceae bacterium]|nr:hypothetical protein [Acidobacteriaceae bacterium]
MPAHPSWFPRLPHILQDLRALKTVPFVDRQAFEKLFQVKDRRARLLMARFAGVQIGNAWAVDRLDLIQALERLEAGEEFQGEQRRRQRVAAVYEEAKREHPARQVEIPVTRESRHRSLASLPPGVTLTPGELRVAFTGFEDFLRKLFELSQAVQNDCDNFQQALESGV